MIHIDTSFLIHALVRSSGADRHLRVWIRQGEHLAVSAIAWAEFLCGPVSPEDAALTRDLLRQIVPFTTADSEMSARLFNAGGRRRGTLADCMIAATAISAGASLATMNPEDFARVASGSLTILTA